MPEGPECTRTARQVNRAVQGKSLVNINFVSGRYVKNLPTGFSEFYFALDEKPLPVKGVFNKGKFIWWEFGDLLPICYMYTTLGMSGNFKLQPSNQSMVGQQRTLTATSLLLQLEDFDFSMNYDIFLNQFSIYFFKL